MNDNVTILIVDDQPSAREVLEGVLSGQGYHMVFAASGPEAITEAKNLIPDLMLLDVMMPGMDGFEVCQRLRADPATAEMPIIMITALDDPDSLVQGIEAGADDFISKPFNNTELRARVRTITRLDRYRRLMMERSYRQQAEAEIERRHYELTLLNQAMSAVAVTLNPEKILHVACEALAHAFELPYATALLLNEAQTHYTIQVEYHAPTTVLETPAQPAPAPKTDGHQPPSAAPIPWAEYAPALDAPLAVGEPPTRSELFDLYSAMQAANVNSLLLVPIFSRNHLRGVIELPTAESSYFTRQDVTLSQSVATAIGQALETAHLHQKLETHAHDLENLVTQRTQALKLEQDRSAAILKNLGEAVVVTDIHGTIEYLNPAAEALTGFTAAEAVGHSWELWHSPRHPTDLAQALETITDSGQVWRGEVVHRRKDGSLYDALLTIAPLPAPDQSEQPLSFITLQRNITEFKEAERLKDK